MKVDNPYVGPEVFKKSQRRWFFGREAEARNLLSLILSERLVLFHAPSGAGKSSLINARLVPCLTWRGFYVLPAARVRCTRVLQGDQCNNVFVYNLLCSLSESMPVAPVPTGTTTLAAYLHDHLKMVRSKKRWMHSRAVLIIDQFEELFTTQEERWQDREDFFDQLRQAVEQTYDTDPMLWVVLTMREDYIARLAPYSHLLPGKLGTSFYMQPLASEAARRAIAEPAAPRRREFSGRTFEDRALDRLIEDLLTIKQGPRAHGGYSGEFVQPLQLQVVCSQLWEKLKEEPGDTITEEQVVRHANVDGALISFFEEALQAVLPDAKRVGVCESELRTWFETKLITEHTRSVLHRGEKETVGVPNSVVELLEKKRLVQPTSTASGRGTYYELIHDRLIDSVIESNRVWRKRNPLIGLAEAWYQMGQPRDALLTGDALQEALARDYGALGSRVVTFIESSQKEKENQDREKEEREDRLRREEISAKRFKLLSIALGLVCVVMLLLAAVAAYTSWKEQLTRSNSLANQALLESQLDPVRGVVLALAAHDLGQAAEPSLTHPGALVASVTDLEGKTLTAASHQRTQNEDVLRRVLTISAAGMPLEDKGGGRIHPGGVTAIEFDPNDPRIFYTAGRDGRVLQWRLNYDGLGQLVTGSTEVLSVAEGTDVRAVSSNGEWVVTGVATDDIEPNQRSLQLYRIQGSNVTSKGSRPDVGDHSFAVFDPTGRWLAWGGSSDWQFLDLAGNTLEKTSPVKWKDGTEALTIGQIDKHLRAVMAFQGEIGVVDPESHSPDITELSQQETMWREVTSIRLSQDGRWLLVIPAQSSCTWIHSLVEPSSATNQLGKGYCLPADREYVSSAAYHPLDSNWLVTGTAGGELQIWHFATESGWNRIPCEVETHQPSIDVLSFSPDGRLLLRGGSDGSVFVWRLDFTRGVAFGMDPIVLAMPADLATAVCLEEDSRLIAAGQGGVRFTWNIANLTYPDLPKQDVETPPETMCNNRWFDRNDASSTAMAQYNNVTVEALSGDGKVAVFRHKQDGQSCIVFLDRDQMSLGMEAPCLPYTGADINAVAHYAGEQRQDERIAVGDKDKNIWVWTQSDSGKEPSLISNDPIPLDVSPQCLAFSPDGGKLGAIGNRPSTLYMIDSESGEVRTTTSHSAAYKDTGTCLDMAFSPDGRYMSVASRGAGEWLWRNLDTNKPVGSRLFDGNVDDLVFSPNVLPMLWLAGITQDAGEVRLWRILPDDLVELARDVVRSHMAPDECRELLSISRIECEACCPEVPPADSMLPMFDSLSSENGTESEHK